MSRRTPPAAQALPIAIEAEQALIGAILCDNTAFSNLPTTFGPEHFGEPFHARLFVKMRMALERGAAVDQAILASGFSGDPAFEDLGGFRYIADLIEQAPPADNAPSYAQEIMQTAVRRGLIQMAQEIIARAQDPAEAPLELVADAGAALGDLHATDTTLQVVDAAEAVAGVLDYMDNPGGHAAGILTGLAPLDEKLGPWIPGDLIALAGRPGSGKSAEAAIIDMNVAEAGYAVLEIHGEMTVQQAWRRRLTATAFKMFGDAAPAYAAIRKRTITFDQRQMLGKAAEAVNRLPIVAIKRTGLTLAQLWALVARQKIIFERRGVQLVLVTIDHAGLIRSGRDFRARVDEQTAVSNGLKEGADRHQIVVQALLQLSRAVESRDDKRPQLHDLRDSGSWEQDCDVVIGNYREAYYAAREQEPESTGTKGGVAWAEWKARVSSPWIENILLKVREGDVGTAKLWGHMPTNTILGEAPADDSFFGGT